jgi:hypothetical protein
MVIFLYLSFNKEKAVTFEDICPAPIPMEKQKEPTKPARQRRKPIQHILPEGGRDFLLTSTENINIIAKLAKEKKEKADKKAAEEKKMKGILRTMRKAEKKVSEASQGTANKKKPSQRGGPKKRANKK